jgi:hypothetical protein
MKNSIYVFIGLFISINIFANKIIVINHTDHKNFIKFHSVRDKHFFEWSLEKGRDQSLTMWRDMNLKIVVMNKDKVGMCQIHLSEEKYLWGLHDDSKYQPFISWTDCPSNVVYSSFDQKRWQIKWVWQRPEGSGDSTVTIDNIY